MDLENKKFWYNVSGFAFYVLSLILIGLIIKSVFWQILLAIGAFIIYFVIVAILHTNDFINKK